MKSKKNSTDPQYLFQKWWLKTGLKQTQKIETKYLKQNPDYDPEDDDMTDSGCVHRMIHDGEAQGITYDASEKAFIQGFKNKELDTDCLYCELDDIVNKAYKAGKESGENNGN